MLRRCLLSRHESLMGQALFAECESVLARRELFQRSPISEEEREGLWAAFASRCRWVCVYYLWRPNLLDEADNHVVELAVAGRAGTIVTRKYARFRTAELHFLELRIVTPSALLAEG